MEGSERRFRDANSSLSEGLRREVSERTRKPWLIERLFNNSEELPSVIARITAIDFEPLWRNRTLVESVLRDVNLTYLAIKDRLDKAEISLAEIHTHLQARRDSLGLIALERESNHSESEVKRIRNDLGIVQAQVDLAQKAFADMERKRSACDRQKPLEDILKSQRQESEESETDVLAAESEFSRTKDELERAQSDLSNYRERKAKEFGLADWMQARSDSAADRAGYLHGEIARSVAQGHLLSQQLRNVSESIFKVTNRAGELEAGLGPIKDSAGLEAREAELEKQLLGLREDVRVRSAEIRKRKHESASREMMKVENLIVRSLAQSAVEAENEWLLDLADVVPTFFVSDRIAAVAKLRSELRVTGGERASSRSATPVGALQAVVDSRLRDLKRKSLELKTVRTARAMSQDLQTARRKLEYLTEESIKLREAIAHTDSFAFQALVEATGTQNVSPPLSGGLDELAALENRVEECLKKLADAQSGCEKKRVANVVLREKRESTARESVTVAEDCQSFNERDHRRAKNNVEGQQRRYGIVAADLKAEEDKLAGLLRKMEESARADAPLVAMLDQAANIKTVRDGINPDFARAKANQTHWLAVYRKAHDAVVDLERLNASLWKRRGELEVESPKLEAELLVKDQLIVNITDKQIRDRETMANLTEPIKVQRANFSEWDARLTFIESEMSLVNASLHEVLTLRPVAPFNESEYRFVRDRFDNVSRFLNATYFNLSFAEESLANTTRRIEELVIEFRTTEANYLEKERILKDYTAKVEAGIIPKVEFKFEY